MTDTLLTFVFTGFIILCAIVTVFFLASMCIEEFRKDSSK